MSHDEKVMWYFDKVRRYGHIKARKYRRCDPEAIDSLIIIGVIKGLDRYNPEKDQKPGSALTYIKAWVLKTISEEFVDRHDQVTIEIPIPKEYSQYIEQIFAGKKYNIPVHLSEAEAKNLTHLLSIIGYSGFVSSRSVKLIDYPGNELHLKVSLYVYQQQEILFQDGDDDLQIPEPEEEAEKLPPSDEVVDLVADLFFSLTEEEQRVVGSLNGVMYYSQVTRTELARAMNRDKKTVKVIYDRAIHKMKDMLAERAVGKCN